MPIATRIVTQTIQTDGSITVAAGEPVIISRISLSTEGSNTNSVTFKTGDGNTTLFTVNVPGNTTRVFKTPFIADKGLKLEGGEGGIIRAVVFYKGNGFASTSVAGTEVVVPQEGNQVAFYPLDSTNGADDTVGGRDGTVMAGVTFDATDQNGVANGAAAVDGVDGSGIQLPSSLGDVFDPDLYTVSVWLQASSSGVWTDGQNRYIVLFGASEFSTVNMTVMRRVGVDDNEIRNRRKRSTSSQILSPDGFTDTSWIHMVQTYDQTSGNLRVYVDGSEIPASPLSGGTTQSSNYTFNYIGSSAPDGGSEDDAWSGNISNVRIWDVALDATEVQTLFDNGL